jgi:hypothetical protein
VVPYYFCQIIVRRLLRHLTGPNVLVLGPCPWPLAPSVRNRRLCCPPHENHSLRLSQTHDACTRWWVVRRQQGAINRYRRHCRRFAPCRSKRTIRAVIANAVVPAICSGCSHLFSMPSLCSFFCFPFFRHLVSLRLLNILAYLFSSRCTLGTAWLPWQTRC